MKTCRSVAPIAAALLLGVGSLSTQAKTGQCREIGGMALADAVVEARGTYTGYEGQFKSFGLIDLGAGKVVLRYDGQICKQAE